MELEKRVELIEQRNARVEADKAWEVSFFRIGSIAVLIYMISCAALLSMGADAPFRSALIPALGYSLSTQSLPFLKRFWISLIAKSKT